MRLTFVPTMAIAFALAGCASGPHVPIGTNTLPSATALSRPAPVIPHDYLLGPLDVVSVTVFREPDLSIEDAQVSLSGKLSLPLLGEIDVAGRSAEEVARGLEARLGSRYLRDPHVSVAIVKAANFVVTIDGEVKKPGVYQIPTPRFTLMQAVALGEGVTDLARLDEVIVIRTIDGQRYLARFDLRDIRAGLSPDPQIQQTDTIIVGYSRAAFLLKNLLTALPAAAGVFVALGQNL